MIINADYFKFVQSLNIEELILIEILLYISFNFQDTIKALKQQYDHLRRPVKMTFLLV